MPSESLTERASLAIESHPRMTKTAVSRLISGKRQDVLAAISALAEQGYVQTTPGGFAPVLTSVKPYRRDHGEPPEEPLEEPPENQFPGGDREPVGNHDGSRQRASVCPTNDRDVPQKTGLGQACHHPVCVTGHTTSEQKTPPTGLWHIAVNSRSVLPRMLRTSPRISRAAPRSVRFCAASLQPLPHPSQESVDLLGGRPAVAVVLSGAPTRLVSISLLAGCW